MPPWLDIRKSSHTDDIVKGILLLCIMYDTSIAEFMISFLPTPWLEPCDIFYRSNLMIKFLEAEMTSCNIRNYTVKFKSRLGLVEFGN